MGVIPPQVAALVKLLMRASALVMAGVESQVKPGSDEYRALIELNRLATQSFNNLQSTIESGLHELRFRMHYMDYLQNVVLSIDTIQVAFESITNPDSRSMRDTFVRECNFGNSPHEALAYLNRVANMECNIPNQWEAKQYVKLVNILHEIEDIADKDVEYQFFKKELFVTYGRSNSFDRQILISDLGQNLRAANSSSAQSLVEAMQKTINDNSEMQSTGCILDAIGDSNKWNRPVIYTAINTIRLHTIQLAILQGACINVSSNGSPKETERLFKELDENLYGTFSFISKWLPKKLASAWPAVTQTNAKEVLKNFITHENFNDTANSTANLIMQTADLTGSQGYVHTVIITENTYNGTKWIYNVPSCDAQSARCTTILDYQGVNVFIFRYLLGSNDKIRKAQNWFKFKKIVIKNIIRESFNYGYNDLQSIFDKIQQKIPTIIGPQRFFNAMFIHNQNFWTSECTIQLGVAYIPIGSMPPFNFVEFYFSDPKPWFFNFRYRLYLILFAVEFAGDDVVQDHLPMLPSLLSFPPKLNSTLPAIVPMILLV
ncbi:hypothetical protein niasHT_007145 [Heterodera trifolii]|uniref:Uncharacterized protein n=1 Tax=Heterodera trifolii TaxID=157864 RepID=A0ABD2LKT1_9BILA